MNNNRLKSNVCTMRILNAGDMLNSANPSIPIQILIMFTSRLFTSMFYLASHA